MDNIPEYLNVYIYVDIWQNSSQNKKRFRQACVQCGGKNIRNYIQYFLHLVLFSLWAFLLTICLMCIVAILCVFVVPYVYLLYYVCIVVLV